LLPDVVEDSPSQVAFEAVTSEPLALSGDCDDTDGWRFSSLANTDDNPAHRPALVQQLKRCCRSGERHYFPDWREDLEQWTDVLNVNLVGAFHTAKAAIPHLIAGGQGGSIVFTSSTAGLRGFGGRQGGGLGYAASKHGIVGLIRTLANALAPHRIRVNTVHPTAVNTMMAVNPAMLSFLENYPDGGPHLQNPMPVELLEPEDISAAIAYLVSDAAKYVTGVTFPVDAGFCNKL
jgi:NAD(P)-dependent dehydrogenase (short-subunit alcohol dehydrogenase family)